MAIRPRSSLLKRVLVALVGGVLLLLGVAMLVLPGPGLLLVLAGLVVLSADFPALDRYIAPIRHRAVQGAIGCVSSPARLGLMILFGVGMIALGVFWGIDKSLPLGGWALGGSLILSGLVLLGLLGYSYWQVREHRASLDSVD